eukprot:270351-Pyramimonas_sp.AAC.1
MQKCDVATTAFPAVAPRATEPQSETRSAMDAARALRILKRSDHVPASSHHPHDTGNAPVAARRRSEIALHASASSASAGSRTPTHGRARAPANAQ